MIKYPFFSIIIPIFNSRKTIFKTISSVINQSFNDFELIIIDDGSTDDSYDLINSFQDARIVYRKISNSGGPARPRNTGIELSKGSWICFLDSDDFWADNKLEETFQHIILRPEVDIWTSGYFICDDNRIISEKKPSNLINKFSLNSLLLYSNPFVTSALTINREKIGFVRFDESPNLISSEDLDFLISLSIKGLLADKIERKLVYYYFNLDGISKNYINHLSSLFFLFNKYTGNSSNLFRIRVFSNFYWIKSSLLFQNNNIIFSMLFLLLSFICSPIDRIYYIVKYFKK